MSAHLPSLGMLRQDYYGQALSAHATCRRTSKHGAATA